MRMSLLVWLTAAAALTAADNSFLIRNATIYPVSGPKIENGSILVVDGRIIEVGAKVTAPKNKVKIIEGKGLSVYPGMIDRAIEWTAGVQAALDEFGVPWQVTRLGCRAEYSFRPTPPRDGREAAEADDFELQQYLHLHALNRGILITPFHNMMLVSPATGDDQIDRLVAAFGDVCAELLAPAGAG